MTRFVVWAICLGGCLPWGTEAQPSPAARKEPVAAAEVQESRAASQPAARLRGTRAAGIALRALAPEEEAALARTASVPLRVGVHRSLPAGALAAGRWEFLSGGRRVWRATIRSAGARAIRLLFDRADLGDGQLWVYPPDREEVPADGPYTGRGPFGDGRFWSASVEGDAATVEYEPPAEAAAEGDPPFAVAKVAHRVIDAAAAPGRESTLATRWLPEGRMSVGPLASDLPEDDPAAACNLDVSCYAEWAQTSRMVAALVFETGEGEAACTGTLVATRNNSLKPYLLTAEHCVGTETVARSVEAFWQFQTAQCRGARPTTRGTARSAPGANLLAAGGQEAGDFALLQLRDVPAGVVFSGWDPGEPGLGSLFTGIHHPRGSHKRISFGRRVNDVGATVVGRGAAPAQRYYQCAWYDGVAEPGSSGSPAFTSPGILVGVLSYGPITDDICSSRTPNGYGRFSAAYPALRGYLEDLPFTEVRPAPESLTFQIRNGSVTGAAAQTVSVSTQSATAVRYSWRAEAPWIRVRPSAATTSAASPARLEVSVDPAAFQASGSFQSLISIQSPAAPPRFVNVRVEAAADRSRVSVSVSPDPVYAREPDATGARWFFEVLVREEAGVGTRLDTFIINGEDHSRHLEALFGSAVLPPFGALRASLRAANLFTPSEQYFELGGYDETTGQRWRRTLAVSFLP